MTDRARAWLERNDLWNLPDAVAFVIAAALLGFILVWLNETHSDQLAFERRFGRIMTGIGFIGALYIAVRFVKWAWSLEY